MRHRYMILLLAIIVAAVFLLFRQLGPRARAVITNDAASTNRNALLSPHELRTNTVTGTSGPKDNVSDQDVVQRIREDPKWPWKRPIAFYGQVRDESGHPVVGATAVFTWSNENGEGREAAIISDEAGFFSLTNVRGKSIQVRVSASGYYNFPSNRIGFEYAIPSQPEYHRPDILNPVVFTLKRRGEAEALLLVNKAFRVPKDGTPVCVDLMTGKQSVVGQSHLQVRCWTSEKETGATQYDWRCEIAVPDGGLLESMQALDFVAPSSGYVPASEISMPKALLFGWTSEVEKQLFLRSRNAIYARVKFTMIAGGDHFFKIESFLNPSGSRNLEFDSEKQPKGTAFQ